MAEKKEYSQALVRVGELLSGKRKGLGEQYKNRENFIDLRSEELFGGEPWISPRHLANVELGKNWISIEKLIYWQMLWKKIRWSCLKKFWMLIWGRNREYSKITQLS